MARVLGGSAVMAPPPAPRSIGADNSPIAGQVIGHASGTSLEPPVRAYFEPRFGQDLGHVRVHAGETTAVTPKSIGATAYAVGQHVVFDRGAYAPGTPSGQRLLAHELAHVVQQDRRLLGPEPRLWRQPAAASAAVPSPPAQAAAVPALPAAAPSVDVSAGQDFSPIDLTGITWQSKASTDDLLFLWGGHELFIVPTPGLVFTPAPVRGQQQGAGPVFGVPAAGHAGTQLVRTAEGMGVLIDVGGQRTGSPNVLLPASLAVLASRMNVRRIDGAVISHGHSDHVANGAMLVDREQLTGPIFVMPGLEKAANGPLSALWTELRDQRFSRLGKGPGWAPTVINAARRPGPAGATGVTTGTVLIGGAEIRLAVSSEKLDQYADALKRGPTESTLSSKRADAAAPLFRVLPQGSQFPILVLPDPRGRDIKRLYEQMGDVLFTDFVKDVRVLSGFQHHLGAVSTKADVEGIRILLKAIGPTAEPLTVVAQTEGDRNEGLVKALQESGVRVVTLGSIDPQKPSGVTFTRKGELRAQGASVMEAQATVRSVQERYVDLIRAADALEKDADLVSVTGKTPAEVATALRTEGQRLRAAIELRQDLATSRLHRSTRDPDVDTKLKQNDVDLAKIGPTETLLGQQVRTLSRLRTRDEELRRETETSRRAGESSRRLRELIAEIEPRLAEQILAEETEGALGRRALRRASRRALERVRTQAEAQRLLQTQGAPNVGRVGQGVAIVLLAIEAANLVEPFVLQYMRDRETERFKDFYPFLKISVWWRERGAAPPMVGLQGSTEVSDERQISNGAKKRIWADLPPSSGKPREEDLAPEVHAAAPLDKLFVPDVATWPASAWDGFRNWISDNVRDFNDFAAEFKDVENPSIRGVGDDFTTKIWQVRTGRISGGHVVGAWQASAELTTIMQKTAGRVISGTEAKIEMEKARKPETDRAPSKEPTIGPMINRSEDDATISDPYGAVTASAHFKKGHARKVYGQYRLHEHPDPFGGIDQPELLVYGEHPAPPGYVLVGGGDFDTYAALREATVYTFDDQQTVRLHKNTVKPDEVLPTAPQLSAEEQQREQSAKNAIDNGGEFVPIRGSSFYYGEVRFPYLAPNVSAVFYVKQQDLDFQAHRPISAPPAQAPAPLQPSPLGPRTPADKDRPNPLGPIGPQRFEPTAGSRDDQPTILPGLKIPF